MQLTSTFPSPDTEHFLLYMARQRDGRFIAFRRTSGELIIPLVGDIGSAAEDLLRSGHLAQVSTRRVDTFPSRAPASEVVTYALTPAGRDEAERLAADWTAAWDLLRSPERLVLKAAASAQAHVGDKLLFHPPTAPGGGRIEIDGEAVGIEAPETVLERLERTALLRLARAGSNGFPRSYRLTLKGLALCETLAS